MKTILLHLWQLPQHLIAWCLILFCQTVREDDYNGRQVRRYAMKRSCSLGNYIFLTGVGVKAAVVAHEYGHSVQSHYLGPLYLIVIGIPSALNPFNSKRYYDVFCERWANKLGGVEVVITGNRSCDYYLRKI